MSKFLIQVTTFFIVKLLFSFLPNEFDTPFTRIICKWLVSKLLKLVFFYVKRKLQEHRSKYPITEKRE